MRHCFITRFYILLKIICYFLLIWLYYHFEMGLILFIYYYLVVLKHLKPQYSFGFSIAYLYILFLLALNAPRDLFAILLLNLTQFWLEPLSTRVLYSRFIELFFCNVQPLYFLFKNSLKIALKNKISHFRICRYKII